MHSYLDKIATLIVQKTIRLEDAKIVRLETYTRRWTSLAGNLDQLSIDDVIILFS
jgi:hypothetical protein